LDPRDDTIAHPAPARLSRSVLWIAALTVLLHAACLARYGVFRDELYYVACGKYLDWGYVDHPPVVALLARAVGLLAGNSYVALRAVAVAIGALTILVTGALTRRLGGGSFAQGLAALAVAAAPQFLWTFHTFSMNPLEVCLWTLAALLVVRALEPRAGERPLRAWVALGLVLGIALETKISAGVFGAGIAAGLLLTRARSALAARGPWIAAGLALALFLPHVLWQVAHGFPTREFVANAQRAKIAELAPLAFLREVALTMNPGALPLWVAGLVAALRGSAARRVLGWAFLVVVAVFLLQRSKPYYVCAVFPLVFATGAIACERRLRGRGPRAAYAGLLAAGGLLAAPLALPLLPVERFVAYQAALGLEPGSSERHELGELPQHFADMHGWEDLARAVSAVYLALPQEERATARAWAGNYGEAGAIDFYRSRYPLPPVLCTHNNYWYWGPGPEGGTLIVIGGERAEHLDSFEQVELAGRSDPAWAMPYQRDLALWVCRRWTVRLADAWPAEKHFN
jgi:hypothetical protein